MKREELKALDLLCDMGLDVNGQRHYQPWKAYDIDEVNLVINELEAENKQLKQEVRCLNVKLSDESNNATILAEKLNEMNHAHKHLREENERLKGELKKWEDRSKVVKDGYDGEVYEWKDNYYVVTPYLNVFVKGLLNENAKLKCLALRGMSVYAANRAEMWETGQDVFPMGHKHEVDWIKLNHLWYEAYLKAKKDLREGK